MNRLDLILGAIFNELWGRGCFLSSYLLDNRSEISIETPYTGRDFWRVIWDRYEKVKVQRILCLLILTFFAATVMSILEADNIKNDGDSTLWAVLAGLWIDFCCAAVQIFVVARYD